MTYGEWEAGVPEEIKGDSLWKIRAYRLGLFLSDLVWNDADTLLKNRKTATIADQLVRAAGHISACIAEGYSRDTGKARAVFYEYAMGSARESRDWYYKARRAFDLKVTKHRLDIAMQIIRLTLKMASVERGLNRRASG
jgi:four helix bundle protein